MAESRAQRTEKPTGKRLQEARSKGNVPRTRELSSAAVLGMFLLFCKLFGGDWLNDVKAMMVEIFSHLHQPDLTASQFLSVGREVGTASANLMFLPVGLLALASVAGNLIQGPPLFTLKPLKPDFTKLNPFKGIKKVVSIRSMANLAKVSFKMILFTAIALSAVYDAMVEGLPGAAGAEGALAALTAILGKVILRIVILWFLMALVDLLYQRYAYIRDLKMTKQEVKDERKQAEGDPRVKAKIRSKQMEAARARMMTDVPNATVVITNPTHVAVAVRYVPGKTDVPQVLAKGQALLAQRIREIAAEHRIPVVRDAPLARALYRSVPVGGFVPEALFRAVAEVLALVLRPRRRPTGDGPREARP